MAILEAARKQPILSAFVVLLLIPVLLAAFAPVLAPIPGAKAAWSAPALPDREELLPGFENVLAPLPLVTRDLPDVTSQRFVDFYDTATFYDAMSLNEMLMAAEEAIPVQPRHQQDWDRWFTSITSGYGDEPVPLRALAALEDDPANGDRLSNLVVAIYWSTMSPSTSRFGDVTELLTFAVQAFPESRGATINFMYLVGDWYGDKEVIPDVHTVFDAWMASNPDDLVALHIAVRITTSTRHIVVFNSFYEDGVGRDPSPPNLEEHLERISGSENPAEAAVALAFLGDIRLSTAKAQNEDIPATARHTAMEGLHFYDKALEFSDEPAIYSGRATVLVFLGDVPAAIETQQRAVDINRDSLAFRLRLAEIYMHQRGSKSDTLKAAEKAREIDREVFDLAVSNPDALLTNMRLSTNSSLGGADRPLASFASSFPGNAFYERAQQGGAGGGYGISLDVIPLVRSSPFDELTETPAARAAYHAAVVSAILGDPEGVRDDLERMDQLGIQPPENSWEVYRASPETLQYLEPSARIIENLRFLKDADLESLDLGFAIDALRYVGLNQEAVELCDAALELFDEDDYSWSFMNQCIAENAYLAGDYEKSQRAYEQLGDTLMIGYAAERAGNLDEAIRQYLLVVESDADNRQIALLRLADTTLDSGDVLRAIAYYDQSLSWLVLTPERVVSRENPVRLPAQLMRPRAHNNRGIAHLMSTAGTTEGIHCTGSAATACSLAMQDFDAALKDDPYNPLYMLNKAWVHRLIGNPDAAAELLDQALQLDPTLYPGLNDLGVQYANSGNNELAKQYFLDAAAENPKYDLALWNLGVLEMQKGVSGLFRGQAYLARAIVQNPSLVTSSMQLRTDESVYRVEFTEQMQSAGGFSFSTASSVATTAFGFVTAFAMFFRVVTTVGTDKLLEKVHAWAEQGNRWLRGKLGQHTTMLSGQIWARWLPLILGLLVLTFAVSVSSRRGDPGAAAASMAIALFAVVVAIATHELGHALVARRLNAQLEPVQWTPGIVLALVLLPFNLSTGPFPGQRVKSEDEHASSWVYLAGPLANLAMALLVYFIFKLQPMPGLRQMAIVQFAAMSYSLLPFEPLDGAALAQTRPKVVGGLAIFALVVGILFSVGYL